MVRTKSRRNSLIFVVVLSLVIIVGATLAWFGATFREEQQITIGTVGVDYNILVPENLDGVVTGDLIATEVSLTTKADVRPSYARVKFEFVSLNEVLTVEDKKSLLALNFDPIDFYSEDPNYTWSRGEDGFYYLVDARGVPLELNSVGETYIFCENITFPNLSKFHLPDVTSELNLNIRVKIEAIQSENLPMDTVTLAGVQSLFEETIEPDEPIGYLVAFETNGGTIVSAEYVDPNGGLIAEPTSIKPGQMIDYWATDIELNNPFNFSSTVSQNMTLYAKWKTASIIIQTPDGTELDEITQDDLYLEDIITSNPSLAIYNFYTDKELTKGVGLNDSLFGVAELYVEEYTQDLVMTPVSGSSPVEYAIGDGENVAYTGTDGNIILPQYYYDGTSVYPVTTINNGAFAGSLMSGAQNIDKIESIKISNNIASLVIDLETGMSIMGLPNLKFLTVDNNNTVYTSVYNGVETNAIIDRSNNSLLMGCANTIIPEGVTSIGSAAFAYGNVQSIELPSSITHIGTGAFIATPLLEMIIPEGCVSIGFGAFAYCMHLVTLSIPQTVTTLDEVFIWNANLMQVRNLSGIELDPTSEMLQWDSLIDYYTDDTEFRGTIEVDGKYIIFNHTNKKYLIGLTDYRQITSATDIPNGVTDINSFAFIESYPTQVSAVTEIVVPSTCTNINQLVALNPLTYLSVPSGINIAEAAFDISSGATVEITGNAPITADFVTSLFGSTTSSSKPTNINLIIGESIPSIEANAFANYTGITSLSIPNNITIGAGAFSGCTGITDLTITGTGEITMSFVESIITDSSIVNLTIGAGITIIGDGAFGNNTTLTTVNFEQVSALERVGNMTFLGCSVLENITLPDSVKEIGMGAFTATPVTNFVLPPNLEYLGNSAFYGCTNLKSIDLSTAPKLNKLDKLVFSGSGLEGVITIPANIEFIDESVFSSSNLSGFILENPNTVISSGVFYNTPIMNNASDGLVYYNNFLLGYKNINPATLTISDTCVGIAGGAFEGCSNLTGVITIPDSVQSIGGGIFAGCSGVTGVVVESGSPYFEDRGLNVIIRKSDNALVTGAPTYTNIPAGITKILDYAFQNTKGATTIVIPNTCEYIGYNAFENSGITNVAFEAQSNLTVIQSAAFYLCNIETITIPASVVKIGDGLLGLSNMATICANEVLFEENSQLEFIGEAAFRGGNFSSIEIPKSVKVISARAFEDCRQLTTLIFEDGSLLTEIQNAFNGCNISALYIPANVQYIDVSAFYGNPLTTIVVDSNNPTFDSRDNCNAIIETASDTLILGGGGTTIPLDVVRIEENAFYNNSVIESIFVPGNVKSIGENAFSSSSLKYVTIMDGVESIDSFAFWNTSLISAIIPASVTSVGGSIFSNNQGYYFCETNEVKMLIVNNASLLDASKVLYKTTDSVSGTWTVVDGTNNTIESCVSGSTTYYRLVSDQSTYYKA